MSKLLKFYPSLVAGLSLLPLAVSAQPAPQPQQVERLIDQVKATFTLVITALFVIATVLFIWGVITYIVKSDDEKARGQAKQLMLWGIIGLAVISAVWGIVNLIIIYFFGATTTPIPRLPGDI